ncbi:MAG: sensor histidine kinase [Lachnospiraceae bacterium]|nr:sensor histidine kinase [Lachnospiraceae bacterium]
MPFMIMVSYTNNEAGELIVKSHNKAQSEEIGIISSQINESISVLTNSIQTVVYDKQVKKIAEKDYTNSNSFEKDCTKITNVNNIVDFYKQDILNLTIYLENNTITRDEYDNTELFRFADENVKKTTWYEQSVTVAERSMEFWYYGVDKSTMRPAIQVSRAIRDDDNNILGVAVILMQNFHLYNMIEQRSADTMLLYNDNSVVYANFTDKEKYKFIYRIFKDHNYQVVSKKISSGINEYQIAYVNVNNKRGEMCYVIATVERYTDILTDVNAMTFSAILPMIIGMIISLLLISFIALSFDHRIAKLSEQMKKVATGDYENVQIIEGKDEIGNIYGELSHMMGDIKQLTNKVVDEQVQKEKLHTKQKEVEFKMLASQINPHFLYNTLETIRMKAMVNDEKEIEELVKMLARIMRYNIQVTDSLVPLDSEIKMIEYYLKIQDYRFGDRIESFVEVDDNVDMKSLILPLIIQPFVENAFTHGLEDKESGGVLKIKVSEEYGVITIVIEDNGVGMSSYKLGKLKQSMDDMETTADSGHIGVANVNQRIKIMYGDKYGVTVESVEDKGTSIIVKIPKSL